MKIISTVYKLLFLIFPHNLGKKIWKTISNSYES